MGLVAVVLLALGLAGSMHAPKNHRAPSRVTAEDVARLRKGMSQAEVESILGPPGDYRTCPVDYDSEEELSLWLDYWRSGADFEREWLTDTTCVRVGFVEKEGRTGGACLAGRKLARPLGWLDWLRWQATRLLRQ
jgi:hypothetical protein